MKRTIPLAEPNLSGNEKKYVTDCLETGWISGSGKYVRAFEEQFAAFCGTRYAVTAVNGTAALHLALVALDINAGDEVIVPDLTYIASANAVTYCGATPVFVDADPVTWTLDVQDVKRKITSRTRAIMPVHLYGHPANMKPLRELAAQHGLFLVEDAAEAHGAEYEGQRVGGLGTIATFSFYGNKVISTGEGGMLTTDDADLAERVRLYRGQGMDAARRYWFPVIGYNYRMTNIQAAIGLAQLERIDWFIERRREVAGWYVKHLQDTDLILPPEAKWAKSVFWLFSVCVPNRISRDAVMGHIAAEGIETRPFFIPLHTMPPYQDCAADGIFPITTALAATGLNLPSSATLSEDDVAYVCRVLKQCL